jgi:hypothetical protein
MTIHTLEKEKHSSFLAQNRIDPITGDLLEENDRIVICAACKSAFLADSWEYIGRMHCNQNGTLREIPKQEVFKLDKNNFNLGYLNIELLDQKMVLKAHEGVFSTIGVLADVFLIMLSFNYFYMFVAYFLGLGAGKIKYNYFNSYNETLEIENRNLVIDRGLKTEKTVAFDTIESISHGRNSIYSQFLSLGIYREARPTSDFKIKIEEKGKYKSYNFLIEEQKLKRFEREHELLTKFDRIVLANAKSDKNNSFRTTNDNQIENL